MLININYDKCIYKIKLNLSKKLYLCKYYKCRKTIYPLKGTIFNNLTLHQVVNGNSHIINPGKLLVNYFEVFISGLHSKIYQM